MYPPTVSEPPHRPVPPQRRRTAGDVALVVGAVIAGVILTLFVLFLAVIGVWFGIYLYAYQVWPFN